MVHCTGGGQSKVLHYLPAPLRVVKDNLLLVPPVFRLIQESAGTDWKEMYQVFNCGQRLEIYTDADTAEAIVETAGGFGIEARISGRVEAAERKEVVIDGPFGTFSYS
jgi:phosphoribosylformylglycinamidine cyclo-ligase